MLRTFAFALVLTSASLPALAQTAGTPEDHDALRQVMKTTLEAINAHDYVKADAVLYKPFSATVATQDHFTTLEALKAYFESLYTRDLLRMKTITLNASADDLAQFYDGPFAVSTGPTQEHYELADGRSFDLNGRWTAVLAKQDGAWKIAAVHTGINFMDNPVVTEIEKNLFRFAAAGLALGLVIGFLAGWFLRRRKPA